MTRRWPVRSADRPTRRETGGAAKPWQMRRRRAAAQAHYLSPPGIVSRPGASALFVSDGPISSNSGRNGGKNAGRNCVSALPQRAMPGRDLLRILADIAFHHRCQSKGLCLRSPARRLTRPLASATAEIFRSYRHPLQAFPLRGPQGDRCPHIPAALAATYPLRCFAPQWARFDNRHSTSAPTPTLSLHQRQRRKRYKRSLNRQ